MRFTLRLFTTEQDFHDEKGWWTLFWLTGERYPRRQARARYLTIALRFRDRWKPFVLLGLKRGADPLVWPKWQPRPWDEERAA